ncbi:MAG: HEAT repeat domain-containing protein [Solirubrobacteraceae bacterium]
MQLTVIQGGAQPGAEPEAQSSSAGTEQWLELAEPDLRVRISMWLAGLTTASRDRALAELGPLAAAGLRTEDELVAAISPATPAVLAIAVCRLAGTVGDVAVAGPRLRRVLADASCARVRVNATQAIARLGGPEARGALAEALMRDDDEEVRARAARGLGHLRDHRAVPVLGATLANPGELPAVRGEAAEALGVIGRRSAVPLLLRALRDAEADVRAGAAMALGLSGGLEVLPALRGLSGDHAMTSELDSVSECADAAIADIQRRGMRTG